MTKSWTQQGAGAMKEVDLLLPLPTDIYLIHQMVWSRIKDLVRNDSAVPSFLYRIKDAITVTVRGDFKFGRFVTTNLLEGKKVEISADIVLYHDEFLFKTSTTQEHHQRLCALLAKHGFQTDSVEFTARIERGVKLNKNTGKTHDIRLPVFSVRCVAQVSNRLEALKTMREGIGRGRRFGFGLLDVAAPPSV